MENITEIITDQFQKTLSLLYDKDNLDITKYILYRGSKSDYQFNQIYALAKNLDMTIDDIANNLCTELVKNTIFGSVEIVKTDKQIFILINVSIAYLQELINAMYRSVITNKSLPIPAIKSLPKSVIIDFSSPNIAKEMHVGHLRSTIIGESLSRIYEFCGSNVKRVNHIGDWGTQFGMLIAYIKKYNKTDYTLADLMIMYKESRKLFDTDQSFNKDAHIETVKLQKFDIENINIWRKICDISMEAFNKIYQELCTHADLCGESFYQDKMELLVKELDSKLTYNDGMKVFFVSGYDVPLIIMKSDGGFTYDTSDLAAIKYRLLDMKANQVIYVVDSGQQLHFQLIFQAAKDLGWSSMSQLKHAGFGLVLGPDGKKLKTRSGDTIRLQDLLDQAFDHAKVITASLAKERHPEWDDKMIEVVAKKISFNCIKYADLSNPRQNNYKFSFEKMLNLKGNTGVYLMYALARCKAILRKTPDLHKIIEGDLILDTIEAKQLSFKLIKYCEIINDSVEQLAPHHLCNYLYDLVGLLTKFYDKNRCIEFNNNNEIINVNGHRIRLIYLVMMVISKFFELIGLEHIEQI